MVVDFTDMTMTRRTSDIEGYLTLTLHSCVVVENRDMQISNFAIKAHIKCFKKNRDNKSCDVVPIICINYALQKKNDL